MVTEANESYMTGWKKGHLERLGTLEYRSQRIDRTDTNALLAAMVCVLNANLPDDKQKNYYPEL
jgi:hypothetical protein